jgi:hypothetical protein
MEYVNDLYATVTMAIINYCSEECPLHLLAENNISGESITHEISSLIYGFAILCLPRGASVHILH